MSDNVVAFRTVPVGDGFVVQPDQVLTEAAGKYKTLILVGEMEDGEIHVCGSHGAGDSLVLLMWAQNFLVQNRTVRA